MDNNSRLSHLELYQNGANFFIGPISIAYGEESERFILRECSGSLYMTKWRDQVAVLNALEKDSSKIVHEWWLSGNQTEGGISKRFRPFEKWILDERIELSYIPKERCDIPKGWTRMNIPLNWDLLDFDPTEDTPRTLKEIILRQISILVSLEKGN